MILTTRSRYLSLRSRFYKFGKQRFLPKTLKGEVMMTCTELVTLLLREKAGI
jgi:hypothetical protein